MDGASGQGSEKTLPVTKRLIDSVSDASPLYVLPKDPVTREVLLPALKAAKSLDVMMGYFSSASFGEIAPGLASYLRNTDTPLRIVISPYFTESDYEVLTGDDAKLEELALKIFIEGVPEEDHIAKHTLECLAWLITQDRLTIKIALLKNALFHSKVWLFEDGHNRAALHGSSNFTKSALTQNREQLTLSRDWKGEEAVFHIERLRQEFDELWQGGDDDCRVLSLPEAVKKDLVQTYKASVMPDESSYEEMWRKANPDGVPDPTVKPEIRELSIPDYLEFETGDFAHQGEAVEAWSSSNRRGILEMATGSGKTITSMICATKIQNEVDSLLVVVSAPYVPLIDQWCEEIGEFGVSAVNLTTAGGPKKRELEIKQAGRRLKFKQSRTEVLVVSNDTLCTEDFIQSISGVNATKFLIADECHNLGAPSFIANPPEVFDFRLGLSATPIRQYDEEGTDALIEYFGDVCFSFTLEDAIGKCLTPYDYHVHFVELTDFEMREWRELTDEISEQSWKFKVKKDDPHLSNLLRKRRLVLETAAEKLRVLSDLFENENLSELNYTLIYGTDKQPEQLEQINRMLQNRGFLFRQLTQEETVNRKLTSQILKSFQNGEIQVLTAKRVLDEGVNIPQIKKAFILASTTVVRQWVQRRGRILRKCNEIGKTHAELHDFVVLPPDTADSLSRDLDEDARKLIRSELERVWEFARLSRNGAQRGGPYEAVERLQKLANECGVE